MRLWGFRQKIEKLFFFFCLIKWSFITGHIINYEVFSVINMILQKNAALKIITMKCSYQQEFITVLAFQITCILPEQQCQNEKIKNTNPTALHMCFRIKLPEDKTQEPNQYRYLSPMGN